jgi:hypothetical protein
MPFLQRADHRVLPKVALLPSDSCTLFELWFVLACPTSFWWSRLGSLSNSHHSVRLRVGSEPHVLANPGGRFVFAPLLPLALAPSPPGISHTTGGSSRKENRNWLWPGRSAISVF